jgi:outer membrane biosynthesis protein TonB
MNKPKDTDLREAMRHMYADTPQLPSDFMERMHQAQEKENKRRILRRWLYPISIGAVAASLLLLFLFNHSGDQPKERPLVAKHTTEVIQQNNVKEETQQNNVKEEPQQTDEDKQTAREAVEQNITVEHIEKAQVAQHKPIKKAKKRNRTMPQVQQTEQHVALTEGQSQEALPAADEPVIAPVHYASPDPYLTMASQVQDIRTRGERLHKEVALLMDNL